MSDESEKNDFETLTAHSGGMLEHAVLDADEPVSLPEVLVAEAAPFNTPSSPVRSRPPPKPRTRSSAPSPAKAPEPEQKAALRAPTAGLDGAEARSIRPMRMIKLGADTPRSESPASATSRLSSRPPPPPTGGLPLPPGLASFDPPTAPSRSFDPPTEPRTSLDPVTEPIVDFDLPTPPPEDEGDDRVTPDTAPSAGIVERPVPPPLRSVPPRPPSARASLASVPEIEIGGEASHDELLGATLDAPDLDVSVSTEEEPVSVAEHDTLSISVEMGPNDRNGAPDGMPLPLEEPPKDGEKAGARKPPPPPKRTKGAELPVPPEGAVAQALEPPKFEPPSMRPRAKPWWEELFTDDFGRGIIPPNDAQVRREVDFIEESLAVAKGGVVLDLGCGNGQHAVELSGRGYGVVGFDLSLPQLAVAGEYAQTRAQKINFLQGDMRDMSFEEVFDGIYCWNTSFGYFEEERNFAVAERIFKALRPGGSFLLDVVNRDFVVGNQPSQVWFEGDSCVCMDDMSVDFITSRLRVKRTMMLDDGRTRECAFSIRIYSLHELGKLLHDIGFRVTEASGHPAYPGVFFGGSSPRVLILAQKP